MYQRAAKKQIMSLDDGNDKISVVSLIRFLDQAVEQLNESGDHDAALRFEIFRDYMRHDFKGAYLKYTHKALGL